MVWLHRNRCGWFHRNAISSTSLFPTAYRWSDAVRTHVRPLVSRNATQRWRQCPAWVWSSCFLTRHDRRCSARRGVWLSAHPRDFCMRWVAVVSWSDIGIVSNFQCCIVIVLLAVIFPMTHSHYLSHCDLSNGAQSRYKSWMSLPRLFLSMMAATSNTLAPRWMMK